MGIDPASANEEVFLYSKWQTCAINPGNMSKQGRTAQFVLAEIKAHQVDELAESGGDRPCQRKGGRF